MKPSVFVFDDFYLDPDEVREIALNEFEWEKEDNSGPYPGLNSINPYYEEFHENFLGGCTSSWPNNYDSFGHFRISRINSEFTQYIHCNPGKSWIGLIYLSKDRDDIPGTIFWRHNRTGLTSAPLDRYQYKKYGFNTHILAHEWFNNIDGLNKSLWTETDNIKFRYNRLVLFRADIFHSHGDLFGTTNENSRLLQIFMWNGVDPEYNWWSKLP